MALGRRPRNTAGERLMYSWRASGIQPASRADDEGRAECDMAAEYFGMFRRKSLSLPTAEEGEGLLRGGLTSLMEYSPCAITIRHNKSHYSPLSSWADVLRISFSAVFSLSFTLFFLLLRSTVPQSHHSRLKLVLVSQQS